MQIATQSPSNSTSPATTTLDVGGMKCAGCVNAVERQLNNNVGVMSASVNLIAAVAVVEYNASEIDPDILADKLTARGFPSSPRSLDPHANATPSLSDRRQTEEKQQLWQLAIAAILLLFSSLGHWHHLGGPEIPIFSNIWFHWGLATLALLIPGRRLIVDGVRGLWYGMPNMNTLVGLGTLSAYSTSFAALLAPQLGWECFFEEPVMLLGFIFLGRTLEGRARGQASAAMEKLMALQPPLARLLGDSQHEAETGIEIPVELIRVGEWVRILPAEKIPIDGEIVTGKTTVDESMLTGESQPVAKSPGDRVAAGTLNQSGAIAVKVLRTVQNTTLAQIVASVEEAQTRKAPVQKLADTIAGYFAYGVMAIAFTVFLFWYFLGTSLWPQVLMPMTGMMSHEMASMTSPLLLSLKLAIAVLVVSCPCALGLATPTAILVGTGMGAERGILIKGGDILERVHRLTTIVFDKTGTLTQGHPTLTDWEVINGKKEYNLLQIAATVESGSNHPLGTAIVKAAQRQELPLLPATDFHTEPGLGVRATVMGNSPFSVCLGNQDWLAENAIALPETVRQQTDRLAKEGKTLVYLAINGEMTGWLALKDTLRPDAAATIARLQEMGLETILATGDRPEVAEAIARELNIDRYFSQVRPEQKAELIQSLQQDPHALVAMVGDGINDAPALARADVGISLQGSTEIALETAGIVLLAPTTGVLREPTLTSATTAIQLSLATFKKIRQNLFWALGYNSISIPIAAGALLPAFGIVLSPAVAAAFMAFSSVAVVTNSLLLKHQFRV
ncbi:heavy metal translocating P-type ATPase [Spirulina sp. 06S082]|uniref:heavy metal translocating P-type ATPase n=1 Tax=Spirulina sp. 06S082 TaxID=3110248 RepID=UPI002B203739|nr:heavy metal translocating P-type ATPase [Spirulina sp. 06S082]MEA5470533.1 heavy metal translocating P-type ATPase [Spirulina sp. 06S082]